MRNQVVRSVLYCVGLLTASLTLAADSSSHLGDVQDTPELPPPIRMPVEDGPFTNPPLHLSDGRIAITGPVIIKQPGSYVLVRDIGCPSGGGGGTPSIQIEASFVDIDLNGFTVCAGEPAIVAEGVGRISIHDGAVATYEDAIRFINVSWFTLRDMAILGSEDFCMVGVSGSEGVIERNFLQSDAGVLCVSGAQMVVRDNRVGWPYNEYAGDIVLGDCVGCQVLHNTVNSIVANSTGGIIADNTLSDRLVVDGSDNSILDNVLSNGSGARVSGERNQIRGNLFNGNSGYGVKITGDGSVYRGNMARGNGGTGCAGTASGGDFCDEGNGNTSHGDNYMPGQM